MMNRICKISALLVGFLGAYLCLGADFYQLPIPDGYQQPANATDSLIFIEKQRLVALDTNICEKTMTVARSFLGTPYVAGCLDGNVEEQLVVNLRELDCWTFVENSVAIALSNDRNYGFFKTSLRQLRYWGARVDGYSSRIHYFTGWLLQAEKSGVLDDISAALGGIPYHKKIGYMSARPVKYPKLKDKETLHKLQIAEKRINAHPWFYIPKNRIARMEHLIKEGDILCLTSSKADLDIAHQGFAVRKNGRIHLMHASSLAKKVIIGTQPLAQYMARQRGQSGIMVARLK